MKSVVIAAVAAGLVASPAIAADGAGARFEARLGGERISLDTVYDDGVDHIEASSSDSGASLGIETGYDVPLGTAAILGAYANIAGATAKDCGELYGNDKFCVRFGRNIELGARAGFRVTPKVTLYGKGGYSSGQLRLTYIDYAEPNVSYLYKTNRGGTHFGGGAETSLSSSTYLRGEYVRTNYKAYKLGDETLQLDLKGHRDQVLMGFGIRF